MGSFTKWLGNLLWGPAMPENTTVKSIRDNRTWQEALGEKRAFVYKHSPICHLSSMAHREVIKFVTSNSQIPIYMVDVLSNRDMSDRIENDLGILHESPQMILLADGIPKWSDSHLSIKADAMTVELSKLG
jgi:bacillithiol system protein YtxJ